MAPEERVLVATLTAGRKNMCVHDGNESLFLQANSRGRVDRAEEARWSRESPVCHMPLLSGCSREMKGRLALTCPVVSSV